MVRTELDHITIVATSLESGVDYVSGVLGVAPRPGGEYPRMATHNCLLKFGPKTYLEVIAINPNAAPPTRPRWYGLDRLATDRPRLATWIVRANEIEAAASASPVPLGNVEEMSRGQLHWRITIPHDGSLPLRGIAPTLIEWPSDSHPAGGLPDLGCVLVRLEGFYPDPSQVSGVLAAIGFEGNFTVESLPRHQHPYLVAHIRTPAGLRLLSGATTP